INQSRIRIANWSRIRANLPFRLGSRAYCKLRRNVRGSSVGYRFANLLLILMQTWLSEALGRDALTSPKSDNSWHHLSSSHFVGAPLLRGGGKWAKAKCPRSNRQSNGLRGSYPNAANAFRIGSSSSPGLRSNASCAQWARRARSFQSIFLCGAASPNSRPSSIRLSFDGPFACSMLFLSRSDAESLRLAIAAPPPPVLD